MNISKSNYMNFMRHPAYLWLEKNDPESIPPPDESMLALFGMGNAFEPYAESLFEGGVQLGFSNYDEYLSLPARTEEVIRSGVRTLFQPRFVWNEFTCISDIVIFADEGVVDLYEIKASTSPKIDHEYDLAFQTSVIEGNGLTVRNIHVIHVNNKYVRDGEIEPDKLTRIADVTDNVRQRMRFTSENMQEALRVARETIMPDTDPELAGLGFKKEWTRMCRVMFPDVYPTEGPADTTVIQRDRIQDFLGKLEYPLYFLDYETMGALVPYFDGQRPYQQIPFQYSLHILDTPDSELRQLEYLHSNNSDPSRPLVEQLVQDVGRVGSVIVWNQAFEKGRNTELADMLPEYAVALHALNDRVVDLMIPFKAKWYQDSRFGGSASIKNVLPVLCPDLSYKELDIADGGTAQRIWMEAVLDGSDKHDKDKVLADLRKYCGLDTLAMAEIFRVLNGVLGQE